MTATVRLPANFSCVAAEVTKSGVSADIFHPAGIIIFVSKVLLAVPRSIPSVFNYRFYRTQKPDTASIKVSSRKTRLSGVMKTLKNAIDLGRRTKALQNAS